MDFVLPAEDDPRRLAVRDWIRAHPNPTSGELAEAGYVAPHWPRPYGIDADPIHQLIVDDELTRADVVRPVNPIGIGWAGPTILYGGTPAQQRRYLMPLLPPRSTGASCSPSPAQDRTSPTSAPGPFGTVTSSW